MTQPVFEFNPATAFSLQGQTAIITGGARGIGAAVAKGMAQSGAHIALFDRDADAVHELAKQLSEQGFTAHGYMVDVTDEHSIEAAMQAVVERSGRIDCLFNNAGLAIRKPSLELSVEDWQKVLDVNLTGVFLCARLQHVTWSSAKAAASSIQRPSWDCLAVGFTRISLTNRPKAR